MENQTEEVTENIICSLCKDNIYLTDNSNYKLQCNHDFHTGCIIEWFPWWRRDCGVNMNTIRLPIRFKEDSFEMEKILENTHEYYANLLGLAVQIVPGALPISTFYGVEDPTFESGGIAKVGLALSNLIPEIRVTTSEAVINNNGQVNLAIKFDRLV